MSRTSDKTRNGETDGALVDKKTDYRMFSERGRSDRAHTSYEGDRMVNELDADEPDGDRTDRNKLCWATDIQRRLIDNKWW